ncbi:MAG: hypothetical protein ILP17_13315 [Lachnospiraceae bacterium]|nr:hypothetical protein [Lachnospiraceae bacterium]
MKDFDSIYNRFEAAIDKLNDGVHSENELKELSDILVNLGEPKAGKNDREATLYAYACAHLANGYYSLAEYEEDGEAKEADAESASGHYVKANEYFRRSYDLFSDMKQSDDRDYLFADCCQMYAEFLWDVCDDDDRKGLKDADPDEIMYLYRDSVDFYERLLNGGEFDTRDELIDVCFNAGGYYYEQGNSDMAGMFFRRARSLAEELENDEPGSYEEILDELDEYLGTDDNRPKPLD